MLQKFFSYLKNDRPEGNLQGLDGLRALAILLVLFHHGPKDFYGNPIWAPHPLLLEFFRPLFTNGRIGVDLFFVLSGFLITGQLLKFFESGKSKWMLWRFFANRLFRVVPAFYLFLLFVQFIMPGIPTLHSVPVLATGLSQQDIPGLLWVQYAFMQDFFGSTFIPMFWTLGVEMKFYLLAPVLAGCLYFPLRKRPKILVGALFLLLLLPMAVRLYYMIRFSPLSVQEHYGVFRFTEFHMRADGLLAGMLSAFLYRYFRHHPWLAHPRLLSGLGWLMTLLILMTLSLGGPYSQIEMLGSGLLIAFGFALILLGTVLLPNEQCGWLCSATMRYIARISYSLYITHFLWPVPVMQWLLQQTGPFAQPVGDWPTSFLFVTFMILYLSIAILAASFYFYVAEKPFLLLKDYWFKDNRPNTIPAGSIASLVTAPPQKDAS